MTASDLHALGKSREHLKVGHGDGAICRGAAASGLHAMTATSGWLWRTQPPAQLGIGDEDLYLPEAGNSELDDLMHGSPTVAGEVDEWLFPGTLSHLLWTAAQALLARYANPNKPVGLLGENAPLTAALHQIPAP